MFIFLFPLQEMLAESKAPDKQKCVGQEKISGKWGTLDLR